MSMVRIVILKEQEFGPLPLSAKQKKEIRDQQTTLAFKNGYLLPDGQSYSGQWNNA